MSDLIDRQAAIDVLSMEISLCDRISMMKRLPSAHCDNCPYPDDYDGRVQVVRCKDCNSADFAGCSGAVCYCMEHGTYMFQWDYCGRAERINNGQAD